VTLNVPGRYVILLNVLLIGAIAYFAALCASDLFAMRFADSAVPPASNEKNAAGGSSQLKPASYYQLIVRRDIFNLKPAAPVVPSQASAAEDNNLRITLLGTSHITGARAFAIIEDQNGDQVLYRQGDIIPDVGELVAIGKDHALILHNGHRVAIEIPNMGGLARPEMRHGPRTIPRGGIIPRIPRNLRLRRPRNPAIRGMPGPVGQSGGIHQLAPNHYLVDKAAVKSNMQDMAKLFTEMRATPNLQNGSSNGFALSEIQPGSVFDQIGLHNGDIVTTVAGQPMSDPRKAIAVLESLGGRSAIQLSVLRNGAPVNLSYIIR
jgi:type II secretion system protein C